MRRVSILAGILTLVFCSVGGAVTLADINGGNVSGCGIGCFQIGDKQFTAISIAGHNTTPGPGFEGAWTDANVGVSGSVGADGTVNIDFNLPATAGAFVGTSSDVDFNLFYTITTTGGQLITSIDQHILGTAGLTGGATSVTEQVFNSTHTTQLANSNVFIPGDPTDPAGEANDQLILSTPVNTAKVEKDIMLTAGSNTDFSGVTSLSLIEQSFHQVPEPAHYALLLAAGMIGLWYKSRKRSQA